MAKKLHAIEVEDTPDNNLPYDGEVTLKFRLSENQATVVTLSKFEAAILLLKIQRYLNV